MQERSAWSWKERVFNKLPTSYVVQSLIIGLLIFAIYLVFIYSPIGEGLEKIPYLLLKVPLVSILISYMLIGNRYLLERTREVFTGLEFIPGKESSADDIFSALMLNLISAKKFLLILAVFIPAIIMDNAFWIDSIINLYDDLIIQQDYLLIAEIFDQIIYLIFLYLVADILWIIYSISAILGYMAANYGDLMIIDLFNADRIGGLGKIRGVITKIIIYYSSAISLALLCYVSPDLIHDIIFLFSLLIVGVITTIIGLEFLQRMFRSRMKKELDNINKNYQNQFEALTRNIAEKNPAREDDLKTAIGLISVLHGGREEMKRIMDDNKKKYGHATVFISSRSIILALITLFEKLNGFEQIKGILHILNSILELLITAFNLK